MSEQEELAQEVGENVVPDAPVETEATEQAQEPPEPVKAEDPEAEQEEMTKSKAKRERRKAVMQKLSDDLAAKNAELADYKRLMGELPEPKESDFEDYEDFRIAKALHNRDKAEAGRAVSAREEAAKQAAQAAQQQALASFMEQEQDARAKYADYDQVTRSMPLANETLDLAAQMDAGPDVIYHLGKNPDLAATVAGMSPVQQALELGRIEARLAMPQPKKITQAAEPITPVGATSATVTKDPGDMSPQEYRAWREGGGTF